MKSTTSHEDQFNPAEEDAWREMERRQDSPLPTGCTEAEQEAWHDGLDAGRAQKEPEIQEAWHAGIDAGREIGRHNAAVAAQAQPASGLDVDAVLRRFLTSDGFIAECDIQHIVAALTAQPAICGYTCTVPDDCETLHWRGQILSMNELASVAQPAVGEEIHVHIEDQDVLTLPLASSGMNAPRFVVHVPAQAQPVSGADGLPDTGLLARLRIHADDKRNTAFSRSTMREVIQLLERTNTQPQPSGNAGELPQVALPPRPEPAYRHGDIPSFGQIRGDCYAGADVLAYGRACAEAQREADRAALAAQAETPVDDKAHPRFQAGYAAGMNDHLLNAKTDDQLGGLLAAIRNYGSWKFTEAKGRAEPDLSDVRAAWDEVYEKVQALAAQASGQAQWVAHPDITDLPDAVLTHAGRQIKVDQQASGQDAITAEVAAEYERWIRAHAEGRDYDDFLAGELAARAAAKGEA